MTLSSSQCSEDGRSHEAAAHPTSLPRSHPLQVRAVNGTSRNFTVLFTLYRSLFPLVIVESLLPLLQFRII